MAKSNPIECFVCGGSYTADQRRRHEDTTKHREAISTKPLDAAKVSADVSGETVKAGLEQAIRREILSPSQDAAQRKVDKFATDRFLDWRWKVLRPETYSKESIAKAELRFLNAAMLASETTRAELDIKTRAVTDKIIAKAGQ